MIGGLGQAALAVGIVATMAAALMWLRVALAPAAAAPATEAPAAEAPRARHARRITWVALAAAGIACLALEWALIGHDFSLRYVADNGGRNVPLYYTVTSLWAGQDGSLLLWLLIGCGYAALLARSAPARLAACHPWAMTVVSVVTLFFFTLVYFAANPFQTVRPAPIDGPGPNPLLRDHPAMGVHPPLLYAGYIGMVIPFGYAVAALIRGERGRAWLEATRRWTLVAWCCLTAGITLGAWWSYAVLGWGGYWAWDPVENASLLPWLTATALLHAATRQRRQPAATGWSLSLAVASFLLVLLGTFLTRSGAVVSVHSFSQSPLGPMLLGFVLLALTTVAGLAIRGAGRAGPRPGAHPPADDAVTPEGTVTPGDDASPDAYPPLKPAGPSSAAPRVLSRDSALAANAVLFVALAAIVLTGTVFPLATEAFTGERTAVGPGYFDRAAVPVALVALLLMGVAPLMRWGRDRPGRLARRLMLPAIAGLAAIAAVGLLTRPRLVVLLAAGVVAFVLAATGALIVAEPRRGRRARRAPRTGWARALACRRRRYGGMLAHAGLAIAAAGIAASSGYTVAVQRQIGVGQSVSVAGVTARLVEVTSRDHDGETIGRGVLRLRRGGRDIGVSRPALRYYPAQDMTVSVPAIRSRPSGDVYLTVTSIDPDHGEATVRLAVNPLVGLVWLGGALTALGGMLAIGRRPRATARAPARAPASLVGAG